MDYKMPSRVGDSCDAPETQLFLKTHRMGCKPSDSLMKLQPEGRKRRGDKSQSSSEHLHLSPDPTGPGSLHGTTVPRSVQGPKKV